MERSSNPFPKVIQKPTKDHINLAGRKIFSLASGEGTPRYDLNIYQVDQISHRSFIVRYAVGGVASLRPLPPLSIHILLLPANHLSPPLSYLGGSGADALAKSPDSSINHLGGLVPPTAGYIRGEAYRMYRLEILFVMPGHERIIQIANRINSGRGSPLS